MEHQGIRNRLLFTVFVLPLLAPSIAAAQPAQQLVIFGDSLSDPGNVFAETGESVSIPVDLIPSAPYSIGGHHFSNGATWIEQLATQVEANPSADPAVINPGIFTNYAFGGARARAVAPFDFYTLAAQVTRFLSDFGHVAPSDAVYVIWIGGNDARDALVAGDISIVSDAVAAIVENIGVLAQSGARRFIVLNVPNLGLLPAIAQLPSPIPLQATALAAVFNQKLSSALDYVELHTLLPVGGQLNRVDAFQILTDIVMSPAAWGLDNVTEPCLSFNGGPFMCEHPSRYLFWDGIHPTTVGHAILSELVRPVLP